MMAMMKNIDDAKLLILLYGIHISFTFILLEQGLVGLVKLILLNWYSNIFIIVHMYRSIISHNYALVLNVFKSRMGDLVYWFSSHKY